MSIEQFVEWLFTPPKPIYTCCDKEFYDHFSYHVHRVEEHDE